MPSEKTVRQTSPHFQAPVASDIAEAGKILAATGTNKSGKTTVRLVDALNAVVCEDIVAPFSVPGFRRSRFDGFAVRSDDLASASGQSPVRLPVTATLPAGGPADMVLTPGTAIRIMTGAPVPNGADAVLPFEHVQKSEAAAILVTAPVRPGQCVGKADNDIRTGDTVITRGSRMTPARTGRLAMLGVENVPIFPRLTAGVLSTGSELLMPGMPLQAGKIYNSTQYTICTTLQQEGISAVPLGIVQDSQQIIADRLRLCADTYDIIITTGGVGGGDFDLMEKALSMAGAKPVLAGCDIRPGGSFLLAEIGKTFVLCLSGGPGSALLSLSVFFLPFLRRLSGMTHWENKTAEVLLKERPAHPEKGLVPGIVTISRAQAIFHPQPLRYIEEYPGNAVLPLTGEENFAEDLGDDGMLVTVILTGPLYPTLPHEEETMAGSAKPEQTKQG